MGIAISTENDETNSRIKNAGWIEANLGKIGFTLTIAYILWGIYLYTSRTCEFQKLDLNELGDFLAGYFGPLALGWLVLGFFQQRIELSQNTAALKLQHDALRQSVVQQEILAHTAERNNADEKERAKAARQPIFDPEVKQISGRGENAVNEIEITNIGAPIHGARASYSNNVEVVFDGFHESMSSTCATGARRTIRIALKKPTDIGRLKLNFQDIAHEYDEQTLEFRPKANPMGSIKKIHVLSPECSSIDIEDPWVGVVDKY